VAGATNIAARRAAFDQGQIRFDKAPVPNAAPLPRTDVSA